MQKIITQTLEDTMYTNNLPIFKYKINYPSFSTTCSSSAASSINCCFTACAKRTEARCRTVLYPQAVQNARFISSTPPPFEPYVFQSDFTITYNNDCVVSLYSDAYTFLGGAHGSTQRTSDTFDFHTGCRLALSCFFPEPGARKEILFPGIEQQISKRRKEEPYTYFDEYPELLRKYFCPENFYLTQEGVVIYYQEYDVAPYVTGITEFLFPF